MSEEQNTRPVFKTLKSFEKEYGTRNFIEVALKETNDGENTFFSISKGFTTQNDMKRYKKSLGFAASVEIQEFLIESLKKLLDEFKKLPKKEVEKVEVKPVEEKEAITPEVKKEEVKKVVEEVKEEPAKEVEKVEVKPVEEKKTISPEVKEE